MHRPENRITLTIAAIAAAAAIASIGCATRYQRTLVQEHGGITVKLRAQLRGKSEVPRNFDHPKTIAGVRVANILAAIDIRPKEGDGKREPAIPTELVFQLGDATAEALAKANPNQEVVVQAIRKERSMKLFTQEFYTAYLAWVQDDQLFIHLYKVDDLVAKGEEDDLREPKLEAAAQAFKALPGQDIMTVGQQTVAVNWRSASFQSSSHLHVDGRGRVQRRQVLMESEPEVVDDVDPRPAYAPIPEDADVLRQLADLEEQRRSGGITEQQYQSRRRELLEQAGAL